MAKAPVNPEVASLFSSLTSDPVAPPDPQPVSLKEAEIPAELPKDLISLKPAPPQLDYPLVRRRAAETHFALGDDSPGLLALTNGFNNGSEEYMRRDAAAREQLKQQEVRNQILHEYATKQGGPVDEDISMARMIVSNQTGIDPGTVFENKFGHAYVNMLGSVLGGANKVLHDALGVNQDGSLDALDATSEIITKKKIAQGRAEEEESRFSMQSGGAKALDYLEGFVPGVSWYRQQHAMKDAPISTALPGSTIEQQVAYLHTLPVPQFKEKLDETLEILRKGNPLDAIKFAHAVDSYSTSDANFDSVMEAVNIATTPGGGLLAKGALKGGKLLGVLGKVAEEGAGRVAADAALKAAGGASKAQETASSLKTMLKSALKGVEGPEIDAGKALTLVGDTESAAKVNLGKAAEAGFQDVNPRVEKNWLFSSVPSLFNPERVIGESAGLGRVASERLIEAAKARADLLEKALVEPNTVTRLTDAPLQAGIQDTFKNLKNQFAHLNDTVLDIEPQITLQTDKGNLGNVNNVSIFLGEKDGTLFTSPQRATTVGDFYGLRNFGVEQKGAGWVIRVSKTVDETSPAVRNALLLETENQTPHSWATAFLGQGRTPDDLVAKSQVGLRKTAVHSQQEMTRYVKEVAQDIAGLSNNDKKMLSRVLEHNRDAIPNPAKPLERGQFYDSVRELEQGWMQIHGKPITEKQASAYFAYRQLNDFDWVNRNLTIYRDKARQGIETMTFHFLDESKPGGMSLVPTKDIEGKYVKDLPWGNPESANIYIVDNQTGNLGRMVRKAGTEMNPVARKEIEEKIKNGYKIVQIANPSSKPLANATQISEPIHFVLTKDIESAPLRWEQLPYRPGGHVAYEYPWFVKQGQVKAYGGQEVGSAPAPGMTRLYRGLGNNIGEVKPGDLHHYTTSADEASKYGKVHYVDVDLKKEPLATNANGHYISDQLDSKLQPHEGGAKAPVYHSYEGDSAIMNFATQAEAKKYAGILEKARQMMNAGDTGLRDFLEKNTPIKPDDFLSWFKPMEDANGKISKEALLNKDVPITHVQNGERTSDKVRYADQFSNFQDNIRSSYNLWNDIDKKFAGDRDLTLPTIRESGTQENPLFNLKSSKLIDPLSTINSAMANVMRNKFMTDYKIQAVENWIKEFHDLLTVGKESPEKVFANPDYYLHNPTFRTDTKDPIRLAAAQNARRAIVNLLGSESPFGKEITAIQQKLHDSFYLKGGQEASESLMSKSSWLQSDSPFAKARAIAFHSTLGLFNPVQLFLQAQTLVHTLGVAGPLNAVPGMAAGTLMRMLNLSEDAKMISHFDGIASKMGMKKGWFEESYNALKQSGLWNVEGEHAGKDDMFDPKLFSSSLGHKFLDKGLVFFREGERITRLTAWNAAYLEWKKANPFAVLDARANTNILQRANLFTNNMVRDSSAAWQQGIFSIPTQFLGYQVRLAEQMLGGRLTGMEKARALGTYAMMYGVPSAATVAMPVVPFYEDFRQAALERGWSPDQANAFQRGIMDGIPATMLHYATGSDFNIAQRAGPNAIGLFNSAVNGDKTAAQLLMGPSLSVIGNIRDGVEPMVSALISPFTGDSKNYNNITAEDWIRASQAVSSINNTVRTIWALNTGIYYSKNGQQLDNMKSWEAIFTGMTGTSPTSVSDAYLMVKSLKDTKDAQTAAQKEINVYYTRAMQEYANGNGDAGDNYMHRVHMYVQMGGFRPDQLTQVWQQAMKGNEQLVSRVRENFVKKGPANQYPDRFKAFTGQQ